MKTRTTLPSITVAAALLAAGAAGPSFAQDTTFVRIGTASSGGNTYRIGAGLASLFNDKVDGVQASVQATKGSAHNMDLLADEEVEIATAGGSVVVEAIANGGQWAEREKGRYDNIQFITTLYPNPVWFVAMEWAPDIEGIQDLKGKRVSVGLLGSQAESVWRRIMEISGLTYDDIVAEYTVHQDGIDQVRNRQVDAVIWPDAANSASISQIMDTGFGRLVDMDPDVIAGMTENSLDYPYTIEPGAISGVDAPAQTWASPIVLVAHAGVDEDLVYEFTKTMYENPDYLIGVHPILKFMTKDDALDGKTSDVHPGAAKYYREIGLMQ